MLLLTNVSSSLRNNTNLAKLICKKLKIRPHELSEYKIVRRSTDARKKYDIKFVYNLQISLSSKPLEDKIVTRFAQSRHVNVKPQADIPPYCPASDRLPEDVRKKLLRPVVIGSGPAGLFAAYVIITRPQHIIQLTQSHPRKE